MQLAIHDFNGAASIFGDGGLGRLEWGQLAGILNSAPLFLQASDQAGREGEPIFDPKGTNEYLTAEASRAGWRKIPVPTALTAFGLDWDSGKKAVLAEWQFSNYPFLWNNVIRTEAVFKGKVGLNGMDPIAGLVVVTKSGALPASNSTLYFEQAAAQLEAVTAFGAFSIPIRLVGLCVAPGAADVDARWSEYSGRYARAPLRQRTEKVRVEWTGQNKYGHPKLRLRLP